MSFNSLVGSLYNAVINSGNIRIKRWPANSIGIVLSTGKSGTFGTYVAVVAAATIDDPSWLIGIQPSLITAASASAEIGFDVSTLIAGTASLSATQGVASVDLEFVTAVGEFAIPKIPIEPWIRLGGKPGLWAAATDFSAATNVAVSVALYTASGIGT